jgi:hypothetical protein
LLSTFPQNGKKPEPVLNEQWFEAKAELYSFTDRIVNGVLGPPNPPGPPDGGLPPFGFSDDEFRSPRLFIDPKLIVLVPDTQDGKGRAVMFPVTLAPGVHQTTVWVKAGLSVRDEKNQNNVETLLMKALAEVQRESEAPKMAEDQLGRVQMSTNTFAAVGESRDSVARVVLESS